MSSSHSGRLVVVLSDIEMSTGDEYDDFPNTDFLTHFIAKYKSEAYLQTEIDLVFNGDTFDFLKTALKNSFPHLIDPEVALLKLKIIEKAHAAFFEMIQEFLQAGQRPRRVYFIVGNHDMELLFPEVQKRIVELCGGSGQVLFPGFELNIGDLHIEHGNQVDSLFSVDSNQLFITHGGKRILNLPWATVTLLNVIMPHRKDFYELDRIKPRHLVFEKIPSLKEFILGQLWSYWTKDFIRSKDPLKKVSWSMLTQAFKRSFIFNPDVEIEDRIYDRMRSHDDYKVYIIGHMHEPRVTSYGNRKLIQLGCFRNEFMYSEREQSFELIPKSYVEVYMQSNSVETSNLLEVHDTECIPRKTLKAFESYNKVLSKKLGTPERRLKNKLDIENQEEKEKNEGDIAD